MKTIITTDIAAAPALTRADALGAAGVRAYAIGVARPRSAWRAAVGRRIQPGSVGTVPV